MTDYTRRHFGYDDMNVHQRDRLKRDVYLSAITVQYIE